MMVIYVPVKHEFNWTSCFLELESRNENVDKQTDGQTNEQKTDKQTDRIFTNFKRNLAMIVIYLPVKFEFNLTNRFRVRVRKPKMWMDRWSSDTSI